MGFSLSVSQSLSTAHPPNHLQGDWADGGPRFYVVLCNVFLLIGWSWTGGFVMGSISRRTVRVSAILSFAALRVLPGKVPRGVAVAVLPASLFAPCDLGSLPRPANCPDQNEIGTYPGGGHHPLTIPTWSSKGSWIPNWALSWPAWYLVAMAWRSEARKEREKMADELALSVNGAQHSVSASPDTPLLYVLRNELKLSGPRLGCGMAQCGACAVLVDGEKSAPVSHPFPPPLASR